MYPYSGQAGSVLEVLLAELRRYKVKLKLNEKESVALLEKIGYSFCTSNKRDLLIRGCIINKFYMDKTEGESLSIPLFLIISQDRKNWSILLDKS